MRWPPPAANELKISKGRREKSDLQKRPSQLSCSHAPPAQTSDDYRPEPCPECLIAPPPVWLRPTRRREAKKTKMPAGSLRPAPSAIPPASAVFRYCRRRRGEPRQHPTLACEISLAGKLEQISLQPGATSRCGAARSIAAAYPRWPARKGPQRRNRSSKAARQFAPPSAPGYSWTAL